MIAVRREEPGDIAAIHAVEEAAFGRPDEADAVDVARRDGHVILSLVALVEGRIAGHILFSSLEIETAGGPVGGAVLAPLAVLPDFQRQGVGTALMQAGLDGCRAQGIGCVILIGHPSYYPRFGFVPASRFGLRCGFEVPDEAFMAVELIPGFLADKAGFVRFPPEWDGL